MGPTRVVALSFTPTVADALDSYLASLPPAGGASARLALTVLAYAEAPGLPLPLWRPRARERFAERVRAVRGGRRTVPLNLTPKKVVYAIALKSGEPVTPKTLFTFAQVAMYRARYGRCAPLPQTSKLRSSPSIDSGSGGGSAASISGTTPNPESASDHGSHQAA